MHFKMSLIHNLLFLSIFRTSSRKHSPSGILMAWSIIAVEQTIILTSGEDTLAFREDIRQAIGMGGPPYGTNNNYPEPKATGAPGVAVS